MGTNKPSRSLSGTVWICLTVITLIFLCASVFSLFKINNLRQEGLLLTEIQTPSALASLRLINGVEKSINAINNQLIFKKKLSNEENKNFWTKSIAPAFAELSQLAESSSNIPHQKILGRLNESLKTFQHFQKNINLSIEKHKFAEARYALEKSLIPNVNTIREYAHRLHEDDQQNMVSYLQYIKGETSNLYFTSFLFLGLGFISSLLFGIIIIRSLTRPIKRTLEITNDLAIGKIDIDVDISGTYEFEALNESLTRTTGTLKSLSEIAGRVANGDYTEKVEVKSEEDRLAKTINIMIDNFSNIVKQADAVTAGNYAVKVNSRSKDDALAVAINNMTKKLAKNAQLNKEQSWLKDGLTELANVISGQRDLNKLSNVAISTICHYLGSPWGAIYSNNEKHLEIKIKGTFGLFNTKEKGKILFQQRKGIIKQVIQDKRAFISENISHSNKLSLSSLLFSNTICNYIYPLSFEDQVVGVIEIASLRILTKSQRLYLQNLTMILASQIYSAQQNYIITQKNNMLKKTQKELTRQKNQLEISSKYKTDFLRNISHELITPLNSLLSFSKYLKENKEKNLSEEQIKSLSLIEKSGNNLLNIISDLLDLSKVEAGKLHINVEEVVLEEIENNILAEFKNTAKEKGLTLISKKEKNVPKTIITDENRLQQILRNFLSNAIKFTNEGSVSLEIQANPLKNKLIIHVSDTGIGIEKSKQSLIFQAFHQADGTTTRSYGGTGLGLYISIQLASLLKGNIEVASTPCKGSTFTLTIPYSLKEKKIDNDSINKNFKPSKKCIIEQKNTEKDYPTLTFSTNINLKHKKILLIEKNMRKAFKMKEKLQKNNNKVTIAYSLKNSQTHFTENKAIELILLGDLPKEENNIKNFELIREIAKINHFELQTIDKETNIFFASSHE